METSTWVNMISTGEDLQEEAGTLRNMNTHYTDNRADLHP
jgi:hypothetical protein